MHQVLRRRLEVLEALHTRQRLVRVVAHAVVHLVGRAELTVSLLARLRRQLWRIKLSTAACRVVIACCTFWATADCHDRQL